MSPAKHSYASVTDGQTDRRTDKRTDDGQSDPYVSLCFAGDTKSASRMTTVLKYFIGLDLLNCLAKFCGDKISYSRENDVGSCFFGEGNFPAISELKLSLTP